MAAEALGREPFSLATLLLELSWRRPDGSAPALGVLETAGGVRSPQAADADGVDLCARVGPDLVLLVADAGLGTINAVRGAADALARRAGGVPAVVALNRFDPGSDLHRRNRAWLSERDHLEVLAVSLDEEALVRRVAGAA
jgi:dethiobiotin synthetase